MTEPRTNPETSSSSIASERELFLQAIEFDSTSDRDAFLISACRHQPRLLESVRSLLEAHDDQATCLIDEPLFDNEDHSRSAMAHTSLVGQQLGDFLILNEVGHGGMGVVYEARQISLNRTVAIKILTAHLQQNRVYLERFKREGRAVAKLQHANIVPVYGVGCAEGIHFYAMHYVQGRGLDEVLSALRNPASSADSPDGTFANELATSLISGAFRIDDSDSTPAQELPPESPDQDPHEYPRVVSATNTDNKYFERIAALGSVTADALDHAHAKGVLHRDIKPSNLLLDVFGNLWITDFGLAKLADEEDLTLSGDLLGTLRYMAPESINGEFDVRSDVYGLGLCLYELLSRERAFEQSNQAELTHQIATKGLAPLQNVPRDLGTIVQKATAIEPDHRYQSVAGLREDLDRYLTHRPILARRSSPVELVWRWGMRNRVLAISLATIALLMLTGLIGATLASFQLNDLANQNKAASVKAQSETREAQIRLVEANINRALAVATSKKPGQRLEGLNAIRESVPIARELGLDDSVVLRLRNAAIACLANMDAVLLREYKVSESTMFLSSIDTSFTRYAISGKGMPIEVRTFGTNECLAKFGLAGAEQVWLSPHGKYLAARNWGSLMIWDVESGRCLHEFGEVKYSWSRFQFDPTGRRFAIATIDGRVRVFDVGDSDPLFQIQNRASCICFKGKDQLVVCGPGEESPMSVDIRRMLHYVFPVPMDQAQRSGVAEVYDLRTSKKTAQFELEVKPATICCSNDLMAISGNRTFVTSTGDESASHWIYVYEFPDRKPLFKIHDRVSADSAQRLTLACNDRVIVAGFGEGVSEIWDARTGHNLLNVSGEPLVCSGDELAFSDFGKIGIRKLVVPEEFRGLTVRTIPQRPDVDVSDRFFVTANGSELGFLDLHSGKLLARSTIRKFGAAILSNDGESLFTIGDKIVERWPIRYEDDKVIIGPPEVLPVSSGPWLNSLAIDANDSILVTDRPAAGGVQVVSLKNQFETYSIDVTPETLFVAISGDARWAATGTWNGQVVTIYDLQERKVAKTIPVGRASVGFSADSQYVFCGSGKVVNLESWAEHQILPETQLRLWAPVQSRFEGSFVVESEQPLGAQIMVDTKSWRELARLQREGRIREEAIAISSYGNTVVTKSGRNKETMISAWNMYELRKQLKDLSLDWSMPDVPPPPQSDQPFRVTLIDRNPTPGN